MVISRFKASEGLELQKVAAVVGAVLAYLEEEKKSTGRTAYSYVKRKSLSWRKLALQEQCFEFSLRR